MKENTRLNERVDSHDKEIRDLQQASNEHAEAIRLHGIELFLLRQLSEVQAQRITYVEGSTSILGRITRRRAARRSRNARSGI